MEIPHISADKPDGIFIDIAHGCPVNQTTTIIDIPDGCPVKQPRSAKFNQHDYDIRAR